MSGRREPEHRLAEEPQVGGTTVGKVAYALAFCVALPALLWVWACGAEGNIALPRLQSTVWGAVTAGVGAGLVVLGMAGLWVHGRGLPMNAFPPRQRAERGVYAWMDHPIYVGFTLLVGGVAWWAGSRAGVWVVSPCVALGSAALVMGYERDDLGRRLGKRGQLAHIRLAPAADERLRWWDGLSLVPLVFAPWLLLYEWVGMIPVGRESSTAVAVDGRVPIVPWMEFFYAGTYVVAVAAPTFLRTRRDLRHFVVSAWVGIGLGYWVCVVFPNLYELRRFPPDSVFSLTHGLEHLDPVAERVAFPSFHVFWGVTAGWVVARLWARWLGVLLAGAVAASCMMTGMHGVVDVAGGFALGAAALGHRRVWAWLRRGAQAVADGWREWRLGPVRVLMHAVYAGLAAGVGIVVAEGFAGEGGRVVVRVIALGGLLGAGAWGQMFEGSGRLARPFGYYGFVVGALAGSAACAARGMETWSAAGAIAVAAPWVQALGRVRCLVQGCCHGSRCGDGVGVRYTTGRSRVCALAGLEGAPIHPTQLYSILANVAIGGLLVRMWCGGASVPMIVGAYFALSGLARFVEEHFRGEPQTGVIAGLRAYQWAAAACVAAGGAVMCVPAGARGTDVAFVITGSTWASAAVFGAVFALAMGVDFPESSRRLARLA